LRILLAPHGTRGDVQSIVAPAVALRARGMDMDIRTARPDEQAIQLIAGKLSLTVE